MMHIYTSSLSILYLCAQLAAAAAARYWLILMERVLRQSGYLTPSPHLRMYRTDAEALAVMAALPD